MAVDVIGIGLDGLVGLDRVALQRLDAATLLIGSQRHLSYVSNSGAEKLVLGNFNEAIALIRQRLVDPVARIVVLTSGDPLFFGLGRLLLAELPAEQLHFHPHVSSVQLAFSRLKVPWQDAIAISAHGRSLDALVEALQRGCEKIAILTDTRNTPAAIAHLLRDLDLPSQYQFWLCENLGGADERVQTWSATDLHALESLEGEAIAPLNVVVLLRSEVASTLDLSAIPRLGIPDRYIASFPDRPGLMTKREVRLQILGELDLRPNQVIWDIGAGTGSVSVEMARLCPDSQIYAIEKTAAGLSLIRENLQRFQTENLHPISGSAPDCLRSLPDPDRIFIGGSGGQLSEILTLSSQRLSTDGVIVLALATLERLNEALAWFQTQNATSKKSQAAKAMWHYRLLQIQLARSVPVGTLTRFSPLNPVTLLTASRSEEGRTCG